ncbi:hypothetical protein ABAZ39_07285 [Azospirillum argentinense]|uniref:Uncharacterized protein n=1 Tax=Azospirillum argentinense TaxID=2970906 RepID=A0A060DLC5_9PROT|nr:hypothetical protein [Azospirillum argentinense]AIB11803.1 hypothetical protein ABAZ39_07285 [Azospirillum argentinense]EZQ08693.1 hypothetical protein ABAZ39_08705 [Azospirillum argentinense]
MSVREIAPSTERADRVLRQIAEQADVARSEFGPDLAGFALVAWDMRGAVRTTIDCREGAVALSLVPTFAHDALNRHVAVVIQQTAESEGLDDV